MEELAALAATITSGARVAWLIGPEGVGKSTLARAASSLAGHPVHRVDVYPEDRHRPLSAADDLAHALGIELGDEPASALLSALADASPSCLLIEDAQWMDEASQVTLWRVIRRVRRLPMFLIVTSTDEPGPLFDGLTLLLRSPEAGRILPIEPFGEAEAAEYLRRQLGIPTAGDTLSRVLDATGGTRPCCPRWSISCACRPDPPTCCPCCAGSPRRPTEAAWCVSTWRRRGRRPVRPTGRRCWRWPKPANWTVPDWHGCCTCAACPTRASRASWPPGSSCVPAPRRSGCGTTARRR
ncbi:ATP-binding protein [Propioniciclava coleopterorum]|uniref:ATP-binding protein n=1 Tax=Propioniciclava coleopterorum TaxID=2714937 RepID=A0A6G7Y4S5_9ACTN|nr:ATP-binding protein [Propioniciclava coleopterorum]